MLTIFEQNLFQFLKQVYYIAVFEVIGTNSVTLAIRLAIMQIIALASEEQQVRMQLKTVAVGPIHLI